jgi:hypothetical protein
MAGFKRPDNKHYSSAKLSTGKKVQVQSMPVRFNYTTGINPKTGRPTPPCNKPKVNAGKCTVLLEFLKGQPILRYCPEKGQRGIIVKVNSAEEAEKVSTAACKKFHKTGCYPRQRGCDPQIAFRRQAAHAKKIAASKRAAIKRLKAKAKERRKAKGLGDLDRYMTVTPPAPKPVPWLLQGERGKWLTLGAPVAAVVGLLILQRDK